MAGPHPLWDLQRTILPCLLLVSGGCGKLLTFPGLWLQRFNMCVCGPLAPSLMHLCLCISSLLKGHQAHWVQGTHSIPVQPLFTNYIYNDPLPKSSCILQFTFNAPLHKSESEGVHMSFWGTKPEPLMGITYQTTFFKEKNLIHVEETVLYILRICIYYLSLRQNVS